MISNYNFSSHELSNGIEVLINKTDPLEFIPLAIELKIYSPLNFNPSAVSLLTALRGQTSSRYPKRVDLIRALERETDVGLYGNVEKWGTTHIATTGINLLKDDYLDSTRKPLEKRLQFLSDAVFVEDINSQLLEVERQSAMYSIRAIIENPSDYAKKRFLETMFDGQDIIVNPQGTIEEIQKVDEDMLVKVHEEILTGSNMKIFVCGDIYENAMLNYLTKMFSKIRKGKKQDYELYVPNVKVSGKERDVIEHADVKQAILYTAYRIEEIEPLGKEWMALRILQQILNSRLMQNLREEKGLVYGVYSQPYTVYNRFVTVAGFESKNEAAVRDLIDDEMKKLKEDKVSEEEFRNLREFCLSIIVGYWFEEQSSRIGTAEAFLAYGKLDRMNSFVDEVKGVSFDDVVKVIDGIDMDDRVSYLRTPKKNGGEKAFMLDMEKIEWMT